MRLVLPSLLLIVFGFAVYINILNSPFYMDDIVQISQNPDISNLNSIPSYFFKSNLFKGDQQSIISNFYRPVFLTVNSLLFTVGGGLPFVFHFFQVSVFCVNAVLVFLLLNKFFQRKLAFFLALLFLVHPANEETAQYIAALSEVLFFCFGMIALHFVSSKRINKISTVFIYVLTILLSMLSKETGMLFVFLTLTYIYLFKKSYFLQYFFASVFSVGIYLVLRFIASTSPSSVLIESRSISSIGERITLVPKVVFYYIEQIATPAYSLPDLAYLKTPEISKAVFPFVITVLVLVSLVGVGFWIKRYFKSSLNYYLFFLIWFLMGIFLHSQIIPLDVVIAPRWIYFPIAGVLGMLGVIIKILAPYFLKYRILILVLYFAYLSMCIYVTERLNIHRSNFNSYAQQF